MRMEDEIRRGRGTDKKEAEEEVIPLINSCRLEMDFMGRLKVSEQHTIIEY